MNELQELARDELEGYTGQTWTPDQAHAKFALVGFAEPFVVVRRRSDGQLGTLMFQLFPRTYFDWQAA